MIVKAVAQLDACDGKIRHLKTHVFYWRGQWVEHISFAPLCITILRVSRIAQIFQVD
jgi:hypothetical protein